MTRNPLQGASEGSPVQARLAVGGRYESLTTTIGRVGAVENTLRSKQPRTTLTHAVEAEESE